VRAIERQRTGAERAEVPDVAEEVVGRLATDGGVARIVGGEVVERRDPRIRLAVILPVEALERPIQPRPRVRRLQAPPVAEALVHGELHRIVLVDRLLVAGAEVREHRRVRARVGQRVVEAAADAEEVARADGIRPHVLEHARDRSMDVVHADVDARLHLVLDAGHELLLIRRLRIRIDQVGRQPCCRKWLVVAC
jgi:hypothetical protein